MVLLANRVSASTTSSISTSVSGMRRDLARRKTRSMTPWRNFSPRSSGARAWLPGAFAARVCAGGLIRWRRLYRSSRFETAPEKRRGRCHGLHGLAFAAVGSAPQDPMVGAANGVAGVPEFGGNPAIAGIFDHAPLLAALDFPADFGRELKLVAAVVDGPGTVGVHENGVVSVGEEIFEGPGAWPEAHIGHANHWEAVPAFGTHRAPGPAEANQCGGFAAREIATKPAVLDDVNALRRHTFVIVAKSAEAGTVFGAGVSDDVDDGRGIAEMIQLIDAEKTSAGKVGFRAEDAVEFDRMADRFVNLEAELATAQDYRAGFCGALWGGVKRDRFFRNLRRVLEKLERLDEFVAAEDVLSAEAVGIGTLLDGV